MWVSLGVLALTDAADRARVGALPRLWALVTLMGVGTALALLGRMSAARSSPLLLAGLLWLPWLPIRVPAAFLIWIGPAEIAIWCVIVAGLLLDMARFARGPLVSRLTRPPAAPLAAALFAVACYAATAVSVSDRVPAGDEPHYLIITQSLWLDGDLRIENNHLRDDYLPYYPFELRRPDFMRRGTDGQIYSVHMPGLSALLLPTFTLAGYGGALACLVLLSAAGGAMAWHSAWLLTRDAGAAWIAWAGVALSTPILFHSFTVYPDPVGAAFTMFVVWWLVQTETGRDVWHVRWMASVGAALATLPWLHTRFAIVAAALGLAIVLRVVQHPSRLRLGAAFVAIPAVAMLAWFGYFWSLYGRPDPSLPYNGLGQNRLATLAPGLPGLLIDQQFGLLSAAPVYAAALMGLVPCCQRARRLTIELCLLGLVYLLAVGSYAMWWAGLSAPARFLLVLLWPAVLPIALLWQRCRSPAARGPLVAAIVLGSGGAIARAAVEDGALLYNGRDGYDLLLDWLSRTVNMPLAFPSFHRDVVRLALIDGAFWVACAAAIFGALGWFLHTRVRSRSVTWALTSMATAAWLMISSTLVWARHSDKVLTPSTSQLMFLQQWAPTWQPTTISLRPAGLLDRAEALARIDLTSSIRGPHRSREQALLQLAQVPAGDYELQVRGAPRLGGVLSVSVGRTPQPLHTWSLEGRTADALGLTLRLPVRVHSLTIEGDETARVRIRDIGLRPRAMTSPASRLDAGYARRAAAYGASRVFFLDDNAFTEAAGFWTHGAGSALVILDALDAPAPGSSSLRLRNGAVPNRVTLRTDGWSETIELAPGESREVTLPPAVGGSARRIEIRTGAGFRPSEVDSASRDLRSLGVWVEIL